MVKLYVRHTSDWKVDCLIKKEKRKIMKTTLLIMAAGIGSRFGTGIKQLEPVDDENHIIMDYSVQKKCQTPGTKL